jgi:hypothetical protein
MRSNNYQNNNIRIKTPHLLRIYNNPNQNHQRMMNIQREHFHFYKPENYGNNKKSKLMSSNGQKVFPIHNVYKKQENLINKNYDNRPVKTDYNLIKDISSVGQGEKKYRKISREQLNKFKHSIDKHFKNREKTNDNFSTTMTKEETLKKNLNRSKSTLLRSISNRKNRIKKDERKTISNKSDVLQILDETIKGLKRLRTIILDDDEEYKEDEPFESFGKKLKISKKSKLKLQLENGIENMNELIRSSITGDIIKKNTIYSKYNSLKNRSITPNESIVNMTQKNKFVIDMEKHKSNKNKKEKQHYKNNSFLLPSNNKKIKNYDSEVQLNNIHLQRNNSQLMDNILKVGKTYYKLQKNMKKQNKKIIRYNNDSGTDTLANFEFSD